jgi:hypothetical protein
LRVKALAEREDLPVELSAGEIIEEPLQPLVFVRVAGKI